MNQQDLQGEKTIKILLLSDIEVKTQVQARWFDQIVPLRNNLAFIYYDGGCYEVYDIEKQNIISNGKLPEKIKYFNEIYTKVLIFHDPTDLKIKMLDLNTSKLVPNFEFKSSEKVDPKSDEASREIIIDKLRVFFLDCEEKQIKYLISQDLEKYYSNNNVCHYNVRILPLNYSSDTQFNLEVVAKYDYPNSQGQTELYCWQVDIETLAIFGQDNDQNRFEILLIKPHLLEKAFYIVHTKYQNSFTILNVSNWVHPHQVAIWANCNDGSTKPSIFTFDLRLYYDGQNWLPEPEFTLTLAKSEHVTDESAVFMEMYQFHLGSTHIIQMRQTGNESRISIINYQNVQKPEIISEVSVTTFWNQVASDHSYMILYNELIMVDQTVKFQVLFPADARHQLLQIIEKAKVIEKYGINNVEEMFEFYQ